MRNRALQFLFTVAFVGATFAVPSAALADHRGGSCGLSHAFMRPATDIQPDPLLVGSPPTTVTATVTFNRAVADTVAVHGPIGTNLRLTGPGGLNTGAIGTANLTNGDRTIDVLFDGPTVAAALEAHLINQNLQQGPVTLTFHGHWFSQPHLFDADAGVCPQHAEGSDTILAVRVIEVAVDIKPQSCPNPINCKGKGVLPVAIVGTSDFDATEVDPASVLLEGVSAMRSALEDVSTAFEPVTGKQDCSFDCNDFGPDGLLDLTLKFDTQAVLDAIGIDPDDNKACLVLTLTGNLQDGTPIVGEDVVRILCK